MRLESRSQEVLESVSRATLALRINEIQGPTREAQRARLLPISESQGSCTRGTSANEHGKIQRAPYWSLGFEILFSFGEDYGLSLFHYACGPAERIVLAVWLT
jgi:hypothetical protein